MKTKVISALAAFSVAGVFGMSLALADEPNALMAGAGSSLMLTTKTALAPLPSVNGDASSKAATFGAHALAPTAASALIAGAPISTPIVPSSSLLGDNTQGMLKTPVGLDGKGFAPIQAAAAAKSASNDLLLTRSAAAGSSLLFRAPAN